MNSRVEINHSAPILSKPKIVTLVLLRCIFYCIFVLLLDQAIGFGTSKYLLCFGTFAGVSLASKLSFTRLTNLGFIILSLSIYIIIQVIFFFINSIPINSPGWFFTPLIIQEHLNFTMLIAFVTGLLAWFFWRFKHAASIELLFLLVISLEMLSGHRNFHFENPRILNSLAWDLGVQQLSAIVIVGALIITLSLSYVLVSVTPFRLSRNGKLVSVTTNKGKNNWINNLTAIFVSFAFLWIICNEIFKHYSTVIGTRDVNGVGQESKEGVSPLDFHSALGGTNQPGALVRLEGDYLENPFSPMLYLRESALSEIKGNELVIAASSYDHDIAGTDPSQPFKGEEDADLNARKSIQQSIYLMTEHKLAFAIDYPISISQLKNPNQKRFKASYRATSLAPAFPIGNISDAPTGDSRWSQETWNHYLKTHHDSRYAELAEQITNTVPVSELQTESIWYFQSKEQEPQSIIQEIESLTFKSYQPKNTTLKQRVGAKKAFEITKYLNKNAIYTLTPNHEVKPGEDPVAPFMFGDKRGYCVHFAHATVYMLRSLGIPSRIGTGYLTDLSQSRDGHILLRMSDRHAWAEVYIDGYGWVPFDTQPEQVESHADTQVDMKLLEELMGMLGPGEEILPSDVIKNEANITESIKDYVPDSDVVIWVLSIIIAIYLILKLYLRFGWMVSFSPKSKLMRSYRALLSSLVDLGHVRLEGETRREYQARIKEALGIEKLALAEALNNSKYSLHSPLSISSINSLRRNDSKQLRKIPLWKRVINFLNPRSVLHFCTRSAW